MPRARLPAFLLVVVGLSLTAGFAGSWLGIGGAAPAPWWLDLFLLLLSVALTALAGAVTITPGSLVLRRALAGSALVWIVFLAGALLLRLDATSTDHDSIPLILLLIAIGLALVGLGATTADSPGGWTDATGRFGIVIAFAAAIVMAAGAAVLLVSLARAAWRAIARQEGLDRVPWGVVVLILVLPVITFAIASIGTRLASGRTFHAQASANRRNSVLLIITMVGIVAATAEVIAVTVTSQAVPALWAAGIATLVGLVAAAGANRFGAEVILQTAGARLADAQRDSVLLNVVQELSIAARIPNPKVYVIQDASQNAFATGRDPEHASVAVTSGLLERMDREELQGVIGHELGHVRNLDTRYGLYVAVMVGLVALVTDGFLRTIVEGWRQGAFFWSGDGDSGAIAAFFTGLLVGTFLLIVALLLRLFAPLFSALVQASTSREREFLADVTSIEFTRNAAGLERALASLASDHDTLEAANRGTQHLWFRNPVKAGSDRRAGLLSTHPSLGARIDRLRVLQGLAPRDADGTSPAASET